MAFIERRAFPRLFFNVEVQYKTASLPKELSLSYAISKDISAGGIRLVMLERPVLGTILDLQFFLPDSKEPISATGRVVWTEEYATGGAGSSKAYDAGIEFASIRREDREKIYQYVLSRL